MSWERFAPKDTGALQKIVSGIGIMKTEDYLEILKQHLMQDISQKVKVVNFWPNCKIDYIQDFHLSHSC